MKRTCLIVLTATAIDLLGGCAPPNVALISTSADPAFTFHLPHETLVQVLPMRRDIIDTDFVPTLEEKILVDDVRLGLRDFGFRLADAGVRPDFVVFCHAQAIEEIYDSYERIPVTDTVIGTYRTRRGYRTYSETVHSSMIVPARRRYVFTRLQLAVVESRIALDPESSGDPVDEVAVWMAAVRANGPRIMSDRYWQLLQTMELWGLTDDMRRDYPKP